MTPNDQPNPPPVAQAGVWLSTDEVNGVCHILASAAGYLEGCEQQYTGTAPRAAALDQLRSLLYERIRDARQRLHNRSTAGRPGGTGHIRVAAIVDELDRRCRELRRQLDRPRSADRGERGGDDRGGDGRGGGGR